MLQNYLQYDQSAEMKRSVFYILWHVIAKQRCIPVLVAAVSVEQLQLLNFGRCVGELFLKKSSSIIQIMNNSAFVDLLFIMFIIRSIVYHTNAVNMQSSLNRIHASIFQILLNMSNPFLSHNKSQYICRKPTRYKKLDLFSQV